MSGGVVGRVKGGQLEFEWEIPDFLSLPAEVGQCYDSPEYSFGDTSWYIQVYPNGYFTPGLLEIDVVRRDSDPPVTATCGLFLKKADGREALRSSQKKTFSRRGDYMMFLFTDLSRSALICRESEFLPSGVLTVMCTLEFDAGRGNEADRMATMKLPRMATPKDCTKTIEAFTQTEGDTADEMDRNAVKDCTKSTEVFTQTEADIDFLSEKHSATTTLNKKFLRDYQELLSSRDGCDVTLMVKGQKFEAHRTILRARSSVFASMFRHNLKEKSTGQIDIVDCDPEYFPDFLRFLYCGSVDSVTSQNVCSLYRAADKYDVQDLKSECLAFMRSHLDVENFCDILTVALQHSESDLIKRATDFFVENMKKIILTVKWQLFLAENPTQGNELFVKASRRYQLIN